MTAPIRGRDDATVKGAVVLVVAIVVGLALLWRSGGDDEASATTAAAETTTTVFGAETSAGDTLPAIDSTTVPEGGGATVTQPPDMVAVVVLNGTPDRIPNIAGEFTDKAATGGYETLGPTNAAAPTETTTIYFGEGFEADAEAMKGVLGLPDAATAPKPEEPLGEGADLADIVVVLGADYA